MNSGKLKKAMAEGYFITFMPMQRVMKYMAERNNILNFVDV
jgi:hypothetical protein